MDYAELAEAGFPQTLAWVDPGRDDGSWHIIYRGHVDEDGNVYGWFADGVPGVFRLADCRTV